MKRLVVPGRVFESSDSGSTGGTSESTANDEVENWIDYIVRSTHLAEQHKTKSGISDWVNGHFKLKFRLAGHIARRTDGRWSRKVLYFKPVGGSRPRGHPCKRWTDDLDHFFGVSCGCTMPGDWIYVAADRDKWSSLEEEFCSFWVR